MNLVNEPCVDVTKNKKQSRKSEFARNLGEPRQIGISHHLEEAGKERPSADTSTITRLLETVSIEIDTRDGPTKLKTQSDSKLGTAFIFPAVAVYLQLYERDGCLSVCRTTIVHALCKGSHPVDQAEVDGVGGSSSASYHNNAHNFAFPSSTNKKHGNSKRQRGKRNRGDPPDRRGGKRTPATRRMDESHHYFACPFYYSDKERHWHCHHFALKRIGDVRQHIKRNHLPPIHCPICGTEFDNDISRDEHINAHACQHREFSHSWATGEMVDDMDRAANESNFSSEEERWFTIWDIMFPGRERPITPYISATYWGLQASVTPDAVNEYRRQERYQQVTGQQVHLGNNVLDDFLSFLYENSLSLAPSTSNPSIHSTAFSLNTIESFPRPTMHSVLPQNFQTETPNFSQTQVQDLTSFFPPNSYQTTLFNPGQTFDENLDEDYETFFNPSFRPGGHDNSAP